MLQTIRDKITGWFAYVFLGAIAIVFVFWGVQMRSTMGGAGANYAAIVNGDQISTETVRRTAQLELGRFQRQFGGQLPESIAKQIQQSALDNQIRERLLVQHADKMGFRVTDSLLREAISSVPEWQADGKFSIQLYANEARQRGLSTTQLDQENRTRLLQQQLVSGILASSFVTPAELQRRQALQGEQRDVDYALVAMSSFLPTASATETEMQSWYDAHKSEYMTEEAVDLEYLELRLADAEKEVVVSDDELQAHYEQMKSQLSTPERRRARHILISVPEGADDAAAKQKAEEVLAKVKAGGDFAALAKQYSQDAVSAAKGGDLDWATRGMFVGPFEDALFSMAQGEVRGPIKTQFGYHVIKLDAVEGGKVKSFDEAREEVTRELKSEKAQTLFYDRSQKMGDDSFKALNDLESTAKTLGLTVQKIPGFSRQGGGALGNDPKVIDAAFSPEAIQKHQNSPVIAIGDDRAIVVRVAEHHAPEQKSFATVRGQIEAQLKQQAAKNAAAKRGQELLSRVESGADWAKTLGEFKVTPAGKKTSTRSEATIPEPMRQSAFSVPRAAVSPDKPAYRSVVTDAGDYAIVRVTDVRPGTFTSGTPEAASQQRQSAQSLGSEDFSAYLADIESHAKIERNPKIFE